MECPRCEAIINTDWPELSDKIDDLEAKLVIAVAENETLRQQYLGLRPHVTAEVRLHIEKVIKNLTAE